MVIKVRRCGGCCHAPATSHSPDRPQGVTARTPSSQQLSPAVPAIQAMSPDPPGGTGEQV